MMGGYGGGYGYDMMGGSGLGIFFMLMFWLLVIGGIVLVVVLLVRSSSHNSHAPHSGQVPPVTHPTHDEAVAIARKRLANGEIDPAEFDELMRRLGP